MTAIASDHIIVCCNLRSSAPLKAIQQVHKFHWQFEGATFPAEVATRRSSKQITEVDVQAMPARVDQNVAVVPVFHLFGVVEKVD